jgi:hypothetical protein
MIWLRISAGTALDPQSVFSIFQCERRKVKNGRFVRNGQCDGWVQRLKTHPANDEDTYPGGSRA